MAEDDGILVGRYAPASTVDDGIAGSESIERLIFAPQGADADLEELFPWASFVVADLTLRAAKLLCRPSHCVVRERIVLIEPLAKELMTVERDTGYDA